MTREPSPCHTVNEVRTITIKDIATQAGVSTATVSYVINNTRNVKPERRQRVLDVIARTNYQPNRVAKSLRMKKTNIIGVLTEDVLTFPTAQIINGISEYIEQTDHNILLNDLRMLDSLFNRYDQLVHQIGKINKALSLLVFGAKVDAIIYVGMFNRDISNIITDIHIPIVVAYSTSSDPYIHSVTYENEDAAAEITRHVIDNGHTRIAIISGPTNTTPANERLRGIYKAFENSGLESDNELIRIGDWERQSGYECMKDLLEKNSISPPTAVIAMNDLMAIGAMDAIREAGLTIPDDISIVGFDNREVSEYVYPKLTTVEIDLKAIGREAAQLAASLVDNGDAKINSDNIVIPSRFIQRDTVVDIRGR